MSRKIDDLDPRMKEKFLQFAGKMSEVGIPFMLTRTRCTKEEQAALYAQGRTKPGLVVTWTLKSRHIDGEAFDIAILNDGKPTWNTKISVNENDAPDYLEAGQIGESLGLEWGGRFKNNKGNPRPDAAHFQLPKGGQ
jgi:peptidoglycan L-alanyl-D-glutamate endopeptidase CwlK